LTIQDGGGVWYKYIDGIGNQMLFLKIEYYRRGIPSIGKWRIVDVVDPTTFVKRYTPSRKLALAVSIWAVTNVESL
jgi:hypothetical protein